MLRGLICGTRASDDSLVQLSTLMYQLLAPHFAFVINFEVLH